MAGHKFTEARYRANRKWNEANYYRVALTVPKAWEVELKAYAADNGTTINRLLNHCIADMLFGSDCHLEVSIPKEWKRMLMEYADDNGTTLIDLFCDFVVGILGERIEADAARGGDVVGVVSDEAELVLDGNDDLPF